LILVFVVASGLSWLEYSGRARAAHTGARPTDRPNLVVQGSRIQAGRWSPSARTALS
jgi:hypothetical protein